MGGLAGAAGRRRAAVIGWALAAADIGRGVDVPVAVLLSPAQVASLPPLRGAALADAAAGGGRSVVRRQVLTALAAQALGLAMARLDRDASGRRRLAGTALFASVAERDGWVAAALSPRPLGVDVEAADAVVPPMAMPTHPSRRPATNWAVFEAALKATGHDLMTVPGGWTMTAAAAIHPAAPPLHVATLAHGGMVAALVYAGG